MLYAPEDYYDPESGDLLVRKGDLFCSDTIRSWFLTPLYKVYIYLIKMLKKIWG